MKLNQLSPAANSTKSKRRLGRGTGSGLGKTSGRGTKGQNTNPNRMLCYTGTANK